MTKFNKALHVCGWKGVLSFVAFCGPTVFSAIAQTSSGSGWQVVDASDKTSLGLPGVTVKFGCGETSNGAFDVLATDAFGGLPNLENQLHCPSNCWASFSFVGYEPLELSCAAIEAQGGRISLRAQTEKIGEVVVTASISGSSVQEETAPVTLLKPYLAQSSNALDLKGLVAKTPGVSILDGQVSIRGGSGYSYGVGTRVQMLLDGMPMVSGDLGEIWWSYLPMEHVGQVEVVKSSASSMYGSGASNGVIHMRTVWPKSEPETVVSVFNGTYQSPPSEDWQWWDNSYSPVSNGMSVSHRQAFGKVDVVAGGSVFSDKTYLAVGHEQRARGNAKLRWRLSPKWQVGAAVQCQYQQMGRFILWDDYTTNAYLPMDGTSSEDRWINWHADAWATYAPLEKGGTHHLNARIYQNSRFGSSADFGVPLANMSFPNLWLVRDQRPEPSMTSNLAMMQYRNVRTFGSHLTTQWGAYGSAQKSFSSLYPGIELYTFNPAVFGQVEWAKRGWKLSGGVRAESNENPGFYSESSGPIWRFGMNRQLGANTNLRFSYGESLRFASIAEKYVEGSLTDGINIRGNVDLISESGNNLELGFVHEFTKGDRSLLLDVAAFMLNYDEMIEYTLLAETDSNGTIVIEDGVPQFFFQPLNLGRTRISGFEASLSGDMKIGRMPVRIVAGGTYNYAGDLTNDPAQDSLGVYLQNFFQSFGDSRDSLVTAGSLLKYRNSGSVKVDVEWDMGRFTAGFALNQQSFIDAVDWYFEELISGLVNYREQFTDGSRRWDARLVYRAPKGQNFSLVVNNLTNAVVSTRPGIMGAPRHVMLKFDTSF